MSVWTIAACIALSNLHGQSGSPPSPVEIGVVRGDGALFPIATRRGDTWMGALEYGDGNVLKLTAAARELPREGWHLLQSSGGAAVPLTLGRLVTFDALCSRVEGFGSDAPGRSATAGMKTILGVAFRGEASGALPERLVAPYDAAAQRVLRLVVSVTHSLEGQRADEEPKSFLGDSTPAARARVPVHITRLARHTFDRMTPYYFESRKRYGEESFAVSGWVTVDGTRTELSHVSAELDTSGERTAATRQILGIVTLRNRAIWVLQTTRYESLQHDLYEFAPYLPGRLALTVGAGGC